MAGYMFDTRLVAQELNHKKQKPKVSKFPKALTVIHTDGPSVGCEIRVDRRHFNNGNIKKLQKLGVLDVTQVSITDGVLKMGRRKSTGILNMPDTVCQTVKPFGLKGKVVEGVQRPPLDTSVATKASLTKCGFANFEKYKHLNTLGHSSVKSTTDDTITVTSSCQSFKSQPRQHLIELNNAYLDSFDAPGQFNTEGVKGQQANISSTCGIGRYCSEEDLKFYFYRNGRLCNKRRQLITGVLTDRPHYRRSETFMYNNSGHSTNLNYQTLGKPRYRISDKINFDSKTSNLSKSSQFLLKSNPNSKESYISRRSDDIFNFSKSKTSVNLRTENNYPRHPNAYNRKADISKHDVNVSKGLDINSKHDKETTDAANKQTDSIEVEHTKPDANIPKRKPLTRTIMTQTDPVDDDDANDNEFQQPDISQLENDSNWMNDISKF